MPTDDTIFVKRTNHINAIKTTQHFMNEGGEYDLVRDFGVILNDSSSTVRTNNKTRIQNAFLQPGNYRISTPGIVYLPANAQIVIPQGCGIWGAGMWENQTAILGDGDIFIIDNSTGGDSRTPLKDLFLSNEAVRGKLVHANITGLGKTVFENVNFRMASSHIYQEGGYAVSWHLKNCYFADASNTSIYLSVFTTFVESGCWHIMNGSHLNIGDGSVNNDWSAGFASYDAVYENSQLNGISITASGADLWGVNFFNPWFENNGIASGNADVLLQTTGSSKINGVSFFGGNFDAANTAQTTRIDWIEGTTNSIGKITCHGVMCQSIKYLAPDSSKLHNNNCSFIGAGTRPNWKTAQYV